VEQLGYKGLAAVHDFTKDYQKAIFQLNRALQIDNNDPETWLNLGITYERIDNFKEALKCFYKVVELIKEESKKRQNDLYKKALRKIKEIKQKNPNPQ
jgi:Flp pilus assembly protein TadD